MQIILKILYIFYLLFFPFQVIASATVNLTQINTDQGLNQNLITSLMQDSQGFLWIGTPQGVNRFDGHRISTIPSPDDILLNNYVEQIYEDSQGLVWIGTTPHNNYYLDKEKNQLVPIKLTVPDKYQTKYSTLNHITEDQNKNLWLATYFELFYFDRKKNDYQFIASINQLYDNVNLQHSIRKILLVNDFLLIATSNELYALNIHNHKIKKILHTSSATKSKNVKNIKSLTLNQFNQVMIGTVSGLYEIDPTDIPMQFEKTTFIGKEILAEFNIWEILEKENFYWLATDKGLYKLYKNGQLEFIFKYSDTKFNTSDDNIIKMIEDREGNLWFGSRADGIFKWRPNKSVKSHYWTKSSKKFRLSHDNILSIKKTPDKTIWIGTQNGINRLDPIKKEITQFLVNPDKKVNYSKSSIYNIQYNKNQLWLNTEIGIRVFDLETEKEKNLSFPKNLKKLFKKIIYNIHFFDQNSLAIFNEDGIYIYNIKSNELSLLESTKNRGDIRDQYYKVYSTTTGEDNSYFIAGLERLVKYSHDTGTIKDFHKLPPSKNIRQDSAALFRDGDKLWITYPNYGIFILDAKTGKEIKFISETKLGANSVMDIFPDSHGNLWFTTNNGLLRINKLTYQFRFFNSNDGFATSEFNGTTKLQLDNNEVLLGSIKGVFHFSPNELVNKKERKINAHITDISLLSKSVNFNYGGYNNHLLELEYDDFGLKLEFSAFLFDKPKQVKYKYWVEGDFATKTKILNKSELFISSFKPGTSIVNISAIDYETGIESPPVKVSILINPAPWLSKKAYSLYFLSVILLLSFYFYKNKEYSRIKEIEHQKLLHSEERLNLALQGGNSGLWDWHAHENQIYEPRLMENNFSNISFEKKLQAIFSNDRENFISTWKKFLKGDKAVFDHTYRMKDQSDQWIWYRDMATVSKRDNNNLPIRITGTYTDITKIKKDRDQMQLYSKAFENTRDIVFVLDQNHHVIAANQSFYKKTQKSPEKIINLKIDFLLDNHGNLNIIEKIFNHIKSENHWEGEGSLLRLYKSPLPILINATRFNMDSQKNNYVFALTDISNQKFAEAELRQLANYDSLTGLPNRTLLLDRIKHAVEHCKRHKENIMVLFVDLDRFKRINDTLGHDIGDLLLSKIAKILLASVRENDTVSRIGGDEFVIILENINEFSVNRIAQKIIKKMSQPIILNENQIAISPSIGIAIYPTDGDKAEQLLKHADIAMYHAKKAGRNNFQYYQSSMNQTAQHRLLLENKLRHGLENNEFYLAYQPQFDMKTNKLRGMEVLARWKTSNQEIISPSEFIPLAEDLGLIITMSEKLLTQAIINLSRWHQQGKNIALAFNLSARHLHHYDLIKFLDGLLKKYPIKTELLEFELTESVLMEDTSRTQILFNKLSEKGIELALDDFGTGYSSLRYLSQLPIKKLKIDLSFIAKIGKNPEDEAIIHTIISLAKSLNLKTLAEGIETEQQANFLKKSGTDYAQGYLYSKPISLEKMEILLNENFD